MSRCQYVDIGETTVNRCPTDLRPQLKKKDRGEHLNEIRSTILGGNVASNVLRNGKTDAPVQAINFMNDSLNEVADDAQQKFGGVELAHP